jgi:hypothetical protein
MRISAALSAAGDAPSDAFPWESTAPYTHHLQDWPAWLEEGVVDLGLPMNYRDEDIDAMDFDRWIAWEKDHQYNRRVIVGTGLYKNAVEDSMAQWHRVRQPSFGLTGLSQAPANRALGICGYSYATPSDNGTSRRAFVNAVVTQVFTQSASSPALPWKDAPLAGHLMGTLTRSAPHLNVATASVAPTGLCASLDGHPLTLTGPETRVLTTDGGGWFGATDLPAGEYLLSVDLVDAGVTISQSARVVPGLVTEEHIVLPACPAWQVYLPLVLRQPVP